MTAAPKSNPADAQLAAAVREKFDSLLKERGELRSGWRANTAAIRDAIAAGRLFGAHLDPPPDLNGDPPSTSLPRIHIRGLDEPRRATQQGSLFERTGEAPVYEIVLDELKKAGGKGAKSADLERLVEKRIGRKLHYKTVGMTLYRLSKKGLSRREGLVWYYVPQGAK